MLALSMDNKNLFNMIQIKILTQFCIISYFY